MAQKSFGGCKREIKKCQHWQWVAPIDEDKGQFSFFPVVAERFYAPDS